MCRFLLSLFFAGGSILVTGPLLGETPAPPAIDPVVVPQVGHSTTVRAVAWSPDGRLLASGGLDGAVFVWDAQTGRLIWTLGSDTDATWALAFSPDSRRLLSGGTGQAAHLWSMQTGEKLRELPTEGNKIDSLAWSSDGCTIAVCNHFIDGLVDTPDRFVVDLWDGQRMELIRTLQPPKSMIDCTAFSPDNKRLALGCGVAAQIWDVESGQPIHERLTHDGKYGIVSIGFFPDGKRLYSGCKNNTIRIWNLESGSVEELKPGPDGTTGAALANQPTKIIQLDGAAALAPDGKTLITGDEGVTRWKVGSPTVAEVSHHWSDAAIQIAFAPDGKQFVTCGRKGICIWDLATLTPVRPLTGLSHQLESVVFSPSGNELVIGGWADNAYVIDLATGRERLRLPGHAVAAENIRFAPQGRLLTNGNDNKTRLWDFATGKLVRTFPTVGCYHVLPGGKQYLCGKGQQLLIRDLDSDQIVRRINYDPLAELRGDDEDGYTFILASADGKRVVADKGFDGFNFDPFSDSQADQHLDVWDLESRKQLHALTYAAAFWDLKLSASGRWLAGATSFGTIVVWDLDQKPDPILEEIDYFKLEGHTGIVTSIAFRPDGKKLVSGGLEDRQVRVWDLATGKLDRKLFTDARSVATVDWSPDGKWILAGGEDGATRLLDAEAGQLVASVIVSPAGAVIVTHDSFYLATKGALDAVAFRLGNRALPFDQFDLELNRPDIVLSRLGRASPATLQTYEKAVARRHQRMGYRPSVLPGDFHLPQVKVVHESERFSTDKDQLRLSIQASDEQFAIQELLIYVNGVPLVRQDLTGLEGNRGKLALTPRLGQMPLLNEKRDKIARELHDQVDIPLLPGKNKIQVSVRNEQGTESLRETLEIHRQAPPMPADRYVLAIGVSKYQDERMNLRYAAKDAQDLAARLAEDQSRFRQVHVKLLTDDQATRENILAAREWLQQSSINDQVVISFAGHGLLGPDGNYYFATSDLLLSSGLQYDEVEELLGGVRARERLILMDTCHSGELDRDEAIAAVGVDLPEGKIAVRGFRGAESVETDIVSQDQSRHLVADLFADLRRGTGAVVISASGGREFALESPQWNNGVFTYAVLQGLKTNKADRNQDQHVQVSELRDYVFDEVRRLTGDRQSPTVRRDNLETDFLVK